MKKIDRLLKSIEAKSSIMEQQAVTLDGTAIGECVRPTYAHEPEKPVYIVIGKEFQPEIENGVLYNVAYYRLQNPFTGEMHHRLVAAYEIVTESGRELPWDFVYR
jgi:hypothetical protein